MFNDALYSTKGPQGGQKYIIVTTRDINRQLNTSLQKFFFGIRYNASAYFLP
jgi:hypothetical protein